VNAIEKLTASIATEEKALESAAAALASAEGEAKRARKALVAEMSERNADEAEKAKRAADRAQLMYDARACRVTEAKAALAAAEAEAAAEALAGHELAAAPTTLIERGKAEIDRIVAASVAIAGDVQKLLDLSDDARMHAAQANAVGERVGRAPQISRVPPADLLRSICALAIRDALREQEIAADPGEWARPAPRHLSDDGSPQAAAFKLAQRIGDSKS
jgi:hypothetical protein